MRYCYFLRLKKKKKKAHRSEQKAKGQAEVSSFTQWSRRTCSVRGGAGATIKKTDIRAGLWETPAPRLVTRAALGRAHSPGTLGAPKQGQLVRGDVGAEEGEALQDVLHQALGGRVLPAGSAGLRMDGRTAGTQGSPATRPAYPP